MGSGGSRIHGQGADILLPPPAPLSFFLLFFFPSFLPYFSLMCKHVGGAGAPPAPTLDPSLSLALLCCLLLLLLALLFRCLLLLEKIRLADKPSLPNQSTKTFRNDPKYEIFVGFPRREPSSHQVRFLLLTLTRGR